MGQRLEWLIVTALLLVPLHAAAGDGPMEKMMQELSVNMARINEGLWREAFSEVAQAAEGIAEHPMPPLLQRLELLTELGTDAPRFMEADKALKAAAVAVTEAATRRDLGEVLSRYQVLQQRCITCHTWYRDKAAASGQTAWDIEHE